jgi:hypothetical protein
MPSKHFQVHSGVLSQSIVLESQCQVLSSRDPKLSLPDVDPSIFELALCYMYGRNYGDYFSLGNPKPRKADADATAFQRHSLLYCFARKYQLSGLVVLTTKNIKALGRIEYQSVFAAAKQAYKKLPAEESWFRKCFKDETKRALMDDRELARESWVVDTIREENGNFASDIFTALMEGYEQIISSGIGIGPGSVSAQKLSRWFSPNLSRATDAHSIQSSSTDWTAGDTNSERDSNTDDLGDDEVVSVDGSSCVEDPTPAGESPCAVEAFPEVEPTCAVENASAAETLYPVEIAIRGEAPPYEEGPPQEEALADAPEEMADGDEVPASALEVEICSDEAVPEHLDECDIWETWNLMKKDQKKRKGRRLFGLEGPPADEPVPELAFTAEAPAPAEEVLAYPEEAAPAAETCTYPEEAAPIEEAYAYPDEPVAAEEMCAEEATPIEEAYAYPEQPAAAEEAPPNEAAAVEEAPVEEAPVEEAPPDDLQPEPLWGSFGKKARKKAKKGRPILLSPPPPPPDLDLPSELDVPAAEVFDLNRLASPSPDRACTSGFRYASLPIFKYQTIVDEPEAEPAPCTSRGYHLARDSRWMECQKCRAELSALARKMAASTNRGWGVFE